MFSVAEPKHMSKMQREEFVERLYAAFSGDDSNDAISVQATSPTAPANAAAELEAMFTQELARPDGLRRIAFAMHPVLKRRLDYQAIGRNNILVVDELTTGDVPFYDVDIPEIGAIFVASQGEPPHQMAGPERIQFPTSNLAIIESVHYDQIQIRRYPLFDRAKERAAIAIAIGEDDAILGESGVMHAATVVGPNSVVVANNLSRFVLAEVGKRIVNQQLLFTTIVMHPIQYAEIWKWSANELDQVHLNRVVETGWMGGYLGAKLLVSTRCKRDSVYGLSQAEKVGHLPERKAVEVKVFDNVPLMRYDILAWEQIGVGIHNTGAVARADLLKGGV